MKWVIKIRHWLNKTVIPCLLNDQKSFFFISNINITSTLSKDSAIFILFYHPIPPEGTVTYFTTLLFSFSSTKSLHSYYQNHSLAHNTWFENNKPLLSKENSPYCGIYMNISCHVYCHTELKRLEKRKL